jgi:hypothetical protein
MSTNRISQATGCFFLISSLVIANETKADPPTTCTYQTYTWNTRLKKAVNYRTVRHPYSEVSSLEKDKKTGCTVCREDQVQIRLPNIKPFYMCRLYADRVRRALLQLMQQGTPIRTLVGYRVGKTRGDAKVLRWMLILGKTACMIAARSLARSADSSVAGPGDRASLAACVATGQWCRR